MRLLHKIHGRRLIMHNIETYTANIQSFLCVFTTLSFHFQGIVKSVVPIKCSNQNDIICHEK